VKAEAAPTPLANKFRTMLDEFRIPKNEVNSRSGDATTESAANTIRSFGDAIRTSETFQTASQQITQPNRIPVKVGNDGWNTAIGQHMLRMSAEQMKTAELELNPPELGPLKVVLTCKAIS
jgi:flagellar hook-length control protein FliK